MSTIIGLEVRPPTACKCGSDTAVIGPSDGRFAATLACSQCGTSRGAISSFTLHWVETLATKFGAPATITLRRVVAS
jgi:hypothetical protein